MTLSAASMTDKMPNTFTENKTALYLFYALITAVPLFFDYSWLINKPLFYESFYLPKRFVFQLLVSAIFLYAVILTIRKGQFSFQRNSLAIPILLFAIWGILSLFNSMNIQVSLRYYSLFLPQIALFFLTIYLIPHADPPSHLSTHASSGEIKSEMMIEKIINVLIIVSAISAIIGILQLFGLNYEHGIRWKIPSRLPDKTDIYSTYGNPNFMSSFLAAVFPLIIINLWHNLNNAKKRFINVTSALIILFCILVSRTKASWLGVIISTVLLLIFVIRINIKGKAFKKYLKASGIIFLAVIAVITGISLILPAESNPILAELSSLTLSNITVKGRELMWQTTFNMIKDYPIIGIGVNTFRLNYQSYQAGFLDKHPEYIPYLGSAESPHNQFLEITAEQGIVGVLLFLWINIVFFKSCIRLINKTPVDEALVKEKMMVVGIMAGVSVILIHGLVEFPLNLVPNAMLYWMYLGFVMIIANKPLKPLKVFKPFKPIASALAIIITTVFLFIFMFDSLRPLIGSKIHRDAWHLMQDKKWKEAAGSAKKGIRWDPLNDELHLFLGVADYQLGNYSESLKEYERAYKLYPDYMIPFNIGLIHKKMGNLALAEEYFKKAIFLRPNLPEPYTQLSHVYKEMGKTDESIDIFNKGARYRNFK